MTNHMLIRCGPGDVFSVLADGYLLSGWIHEGSRVQGLDQAWPLPGSKSRHASRLGPIPLHDGAAIIEWDPPRHMVLTIHGRLVGSTLITLDVERGANGCLAHLTETVVRGPGLLVPPPIRRAGLHLQNGERLQRLARLAETRAERPGAGRRSYV
ncbi:MAG: hypothetical protein ABWY56_16335 [Propionibacteriaceae bacterium]